MTANAVDGRHLDDSFSGTQRVAGVNGDLAGYSVAALGDFNGDGLGDFAVGAPNHGWADEGSVFIVHGGTAAVEAPDGTVRAVNQKDIFTRGCNEDIGATPGPLDGEEGMAVFGQDRSGSNDLFYHYGMTIGPGGDFDGDGYDDLLVQGPPIALTNTATLVRGGPGRTSISIESAFDNPDRMLPIDLGDFRIVNLGGGKVGRVGRIGIGAPAGGGGDVNGDGLGDLVFQSKHTDSGGFMHILLGRRGDDGYLDLDEELPLAEGGTMIWAGPWAARRTSRSRTTAKASPASSATSTVTATTMRPWACRSPMSPSVARWPWCSAARRPSKG